MATKTTIIVTGFGPFGFHSTNASWEAVQELANIGFGDNINVITKEIPVEYETVNKLVPKLWETFKPKLCLHVGVSPCTDVVQLEKCALNDNYDRVDISDKCPDKNCCVPGGRKCHFTNINVEKICEESTQDKCPCKLETSSDPGRYLCEFIYYKSLNESVKAENEGSLVLFIHVPILDEPYSKTQLAQALKYVVLEALKEENLIEQCEHENECTCHLT